MVMVMPEVFAGSAVFSVEILSLSVNSSNFSSLSLTERGERGRWPCLRNVYRNPIQLPNINIVSDTAIISILFIALLPCSKRILEHKSQPQQMVLQYHLLHTVQLDTAQDGHGVQTRVHLTVDGPCGLVH